MAASKHLPDIEQLIAEFEASGLRELHARHGEFEVYLSDDTASAGLSGSGESGHSGAASNVQLPARAISSDQAATYPAPAAEPAGDWPESAVVVRAPYLGTFYRSPKPGSAPFVEVGQNVASGADMCLVEVMKLFTAVRAECAGTVHSVLASDGEMVAANQPLFVVLPG